MVNRIKWTMDHFKLSASEFADKIGVQRSAVSHVLSGRNKPSLDFLIKIKKQYPTINLDWLVLGSGNPLSKQDSDLFGNIQNDEGVDESFRQEKFDEGQETLVKNTTDTNNRSGQLEGNIENMLLKDQAKAGNKKLKRVILLYNDGSFQAFEQGI